MVFPARIGPAGAGNFRAFRSPASSGHSGSRQFPGVQASGLFRVFRRLANRARINPATAAPARTPAKSRHTSLICGLRSLRPCRLSSIIAAASPQTAVTMQAFLPGKAGSRSAGRASLVSEVSELGTARASISIPRTANSVKCASFRTKCSLTVSGLPEILPRTSLKCRSAQVLISVDSSRGIRELPQIKASVRMIRIVSMMFLYFQALNFVQHLPARRCAGVQHLPRLRSSAFTLLTPRTEGNQRACSRPCRRVYSDRNYCHNRSAQGFCR